MAANTIFTVQTGCSFLYDNHKSKFLVLDQFDSDLLDSQSSAFGHPEARSPAPTWATCCLRITTDHLPKDPHVGFVFGSDKKTADILVSGKGHISRRLFSVRIDQTGILLLQNLSSHGTNVKSQLLFSGSVKLRAQRDLFWNVDFGVSISDVSFTVCLPNHAWDQFAGPWTTYLGKVASVMPNIEHLGIMSDASATITPYTYHSAGPDLIDPALHDSSLATGGSYATWEGEGDVQPAPATGGSYATWEEEGDVQPAPAAGGSYATWEGAGEPPRKKRHVFSKDERDTLEAKWNNTPDGLIDDQTATDLAQSLGLSRVQIKDWFRYQRRKTRPEKELRPPSLPAGFAGLRWDSGFVVYRPSKRDINMIHILKNAGWKERVVELRQKISDIVPVTDKDTVGGRGTSGMYCSFDHAQKACRQLGINCYVLDRLMEDSGTVPVE